MGKGVFILLGERIKKLRKEKKLTLEALAGNQLTKGMLSLIENNKAQPSMESLAYIAEQLEVEVADLLEVISSEDLRNLLEKVETIYRIDREKMKDKYSQLKELIEPFVENLTQGYEAARILEIYSYSLFHEMQPGWEEFSERAAQMFDKLNIASNRSAIAIKRALTKFLSHEYQEALDIFVRERRIIEAKFVYIDPMTRLDLDYHEAILYYAVGDSTSATTIMERALALSKEKQLFYKIDELYRLAAAQATLSRNEEKRTYYLEKLRQYSEFADNKGSLLFYKLMNVMVLISEKQLYQKALDEIEPFLVNHEENDFYRPWFLLEKGKALYYLERYEQALAILEEITLPEVHHPFDLSDFYLLDTYRALCYYELDNHESALDAIKKAIANFQLLPDINKKYKVFTQETFDKITKNTQ